MNTESKKVRIAGYVRVSSVRQATEGDSLQAQQHEIEQEIEFRKRRENWDVVSLEFYTDAGKSAKDQNRPELQRLKRDIAGGEIDVVICFKLDRITRSLKDFVDSGSFSTSTTWMSSRSGKNLTHRCRPERP